MPTEMYGKKQLQWKDFPQRNYAWSPERRRFVRYPCAWKVKFCELSNSELPEFLHTGKCKNISQSGMKITSFHALQRNAFVLVQFDLLLFSKHIKLDLILKITQNRLLARVVWRHLNLETQIFEAGLEFLLETQRAKCKYLIDQACLIR